MSALLHTREIICEPDLEDPVGGDLVENHHVAVLLQNAIACAVAVERSNLARKLAVGINDQFSA
jgi:hypothetical protein